jgi:hypothetical protein
MSVREREVRFNFERALLLQGEDTYTFDDCLNCNSDTSCATSKLSGINSEGIEKSNELTGDETCVSEIVCDCVEGSRCMFCAPNFLDKCIGRQHVPPETPVSDTNSASVYVANKTPTRGKGIRPKPTNRRRMHSVHDGDMNLKLKFVTPDNVKLKVNFDTQATICCCSPAALEQLNEYRMSQGKLPIQTTSYGPGIRVDTANDIVRTHKHFNLRLKDTAPWGENRFITCKFWVLKNLATDWIMGRNHGRRFHYVVAHRSQLKDDIDDVVHSSGLNIGGSEEVQRANNPNYMIDDTFLSRLDHPWHNREFFEPELTKWIMDYRFRDRNGK